MTTQTKLTPKQEAFCLSYLETSNASESYRRCYNAGKMKIEGIWVNACKLLASTKVALRVAELQALAAKRNEITIDDLIVELEEARKIAFGALIPQSSAAVSATMGKAKILGFLVDKAEITGKDGKDLMQTPIDLVRAELAALISKGNPAKHK